MYGKNACPYHIFSSKLKGINKSLLNIPQKTDNNYSNNTLDLNPSSINIVLTI